MCSRWTSGTIFRANPTENTCLMDVFPEVYMLWAGRMLLQSDIMSSPCMHPPPPPVLKSLAPILHSLTFDLISDWHSAPSWDKRSLVQTVLTEM